MFLNERERERTERGIYKERGRTERKEVCRQRKRERKIEISLSDQKFG